jgi:hypothetical protein
VALTTHPHLAIILLPPELDGLLQGEMSTPYAVTTIIAQLRGYTFRLLLLVNSVLQTGSRA